MNGKNTEKIKREEQLGFVRGMIYENEEIGLVRGMEYEDEPEYIPGMTYLPKGYRSYEEWKWEPSILQKVPEQERIKEQEKNTVAGKAEKKERHMPKQKLENILSRLELLNFDLSLNKKICEILDKENGEWVKRQYEISIKVFLKNGKERIFKTVVNADQVKKSEWVTKATNSLATVPKNQNEKSEFHSKVQLCIEADVPMEIIYPTAGWRNVPEWGWRYVYGGGIIGGENMLVHVGNGNKYLLDIQKEKLGSPEIFAEALQMCSICYPQAVSTELFLFVHTTVLNTLFELAGYMVNFVFGISGVTNSRKTSLVLAMAKLFDRHKLVADAEFATATRCGIEKVLGTYKDGPVLIDDFKPGVTRMEQSAMDHKLDELVRLYGNRVVKKRMMDFSANGDEKYFPVSGGCILTMEVVTGVMSSVSRMFITELEKDTVDNVKLRHYQEERGILPTHFYDFIAWVTSNFSSIVTFIRDEYSNRRDKITLSIGRYADMFAILSITGSIICRYALQKGFWGNREAEDFLENIEKIIIAELMNMEHRIYHRDKAYIVLDAFFEGIRTKRIVPMELTPENTARMDEVYEDSGLFYIRTKALRKLVNEYSGMYKEHCEIINDDELLGLLERLEVLEVHERDGRCERSRKLPYSKDNALRYLYLKKATLMNALK